MWYQGATLYYNKTCCATWVDRLDSYHHINEKLHLRACDPSDMHCESQKNQHTCMLGL